LQLDCTDFRRGLAGELVDDPADVGCHGTEVATLHGGIDLHGVLQVVLRHHGIGDVAL